MRFLWLFIWCVMFGMAVSHDFGYPQPFTNDFYFAWAILALVQMVHVWVINQIFPKALIPAKVNISQLIIDQSKGLVTFTMRISEVQKRYTTKLVQEMLTKELTRLQVELQKYSHLEIEKDFNLIVNVNDKDPSQFLYVIETKTDKAKAILCDISKSFDLMSLM